MRKFSLSLLVLWFVAGSINTAFAQLQVLRDQGTGNPVIANPYPEVKGSPYWSDFEMGKVIFSNKDTAENLMISFNAFNQTLVYRHNGELMAYNPKMIAGFILNPDTRPSLFRSGYNIPGLGADRFVEVLADGKYTLINHKHKVMIDDPSATYGSQRAKAFQSSEQLYLFNNGEAKAWKTRKKQLMEIFGDDFDQVRKLEIDYELDLKEKNDVRRLVMLLNLNR